jgi:hypothetical protein
VYAARHIAQGTTQHTTRAEPSAFACERLRGEEEEEPEEEEEELGAPASAPLKPNTLLATTPTSGVASAPTAPSKLLSKA